MTYYFTQPKKAVFGENALADCGDAIRAMGKKALVVTGPVVTKAGLTKRLTDCLDAWNVGYSIYSAITAEPTDEMVCDGVKAFREEMCDFLIGIGGGSPLDSVKAIAAMSVLGGQIGDYLGTELAGDFPPTVLIPTTAGTGSEATKFTIITDVRKDIKMLLKGEDLLPDLAVIDPTLTYTAPGNVVAATGMDALTHAVEAYTSRKGNALTDVYAMDAVKRIFRYLPDAYRNPGDTVARREMSVAAYEAGVCINNASVTLVHGMSRPIGALFHIPHGISNAMLIEECLTFALDGCNGRFAAIAREIGAATHHMGEQEAAGRFLKELGALCRTLDIPTLGEYGIEETAFFDRIDKMAEDAMASGSPSNTIREVRKEDLIRIYKKLW